MKKRLLDAIGLIVVVAFGLGAAWWVDQRATVQLMGVRSTSAAFGFIVEGRPVHPRVGFHADNPAGLDGAPQNDELTSG
jgi:hypothetical protein